MKEDLRLTLEGNQISLSSGLFHAYQLLYSSTQDSTYHLDLSSSHTSVLIYQASFL